MLLWREAGIGRTAHRIGALEIDCGVGTVNRTDRRPLDSNGSIVPHRTEPRTATHRPSGSLAFHLDLRLNRLAVCEGSRRLAA